MQNGLQEYCAIMPKGGLNQTYLFVRLHSDAFWPQKSKNFLHWKERHPLRWRLSRSSVSQAYEAEISFQQTRLLCPTQQPLHDLRSDFCVALSYRPWVRQDRDDSPAQTQWTQLSWFSTASRRWPPSDTIRRSMAGPRTIPLSASTALPRTTGTENSGQAMLTPLRGILDFHRSVFCESPSLGKSRNHQGGQGVFRSQGCRISGIQERPVCYRRQADTADQKKACGVIVPPLLFRHRDSRICVSHQGRAQRASVHRDSTTDPRRPIRSAYFVYPKGDYPLAKIPTKHLAANEAYFHILLFSYNLINWFKRLCLPKEVQKVTLNTLRARLLLIPGTLVKSENRPMLKLLANFWYRDAFEYAIKKIARLKF